MDARTAALSSGSGGLAAISAALPGSESALILISSCSSGTLRTSGAVCFSSSRSREEAHAEAGPHPPRSSTPLFGRGLRDEDVVERCEPRGWIVCEQLGAAGINNKGHVVDGDRSLGDVGSEDDLGHAGRA